MDTKCIDAVFGEMTYKHRWVKEDKEVFFGKEEEIKIVAKAYSGKPITDEQRDAYSRYLSNNDEIKRTVEDQLMGYINNNIEELAEYWVGARKIEKIEELANVVSVKTVLFKQDGTTLILMECAWDVENGVAVKVYPDVAVGSQDLFL